MEMKVKVVCIYEDKSVAHAVASGVQPDNIQAPEGVEIETHNEGARVITKVEVDGEIKTLLATLEDLLSCTSTAEKIL